MKPCDKCGKNTYIMRYVYHGALLKVCKDCKKKIKLGGW